MQAYGAESLVQTQGLGHNTITDKQWKRRPSKLQTDDKNGVLVKPFFMKTAVSACRSKFDGKSTTAGSSTMITQVLISLYWWRWGSFFLYLYHLKNNSAIQSWVGPLWLLSVPESQEGSLRDIILHLSKLFRSHDQRCTQHFIPEKVFWQWTVETTLDSLYQCARALFREMLKVFAVCFAPYLKRIFSHYFCNEPYIKIKI